MNILVLVAHPDDPEFFCGATIAKWTSEGHRVRYVLVTDGSKGNDDPNISAEHLVAMRQDEQRAAGAILGVDDISFLTYIDGELANTLALQRDLAREVRAFKPDIVVTTDPQTLHFGALRVNHNDHRVIGMAVCDAIFPASGNRMYFTELFEEGLEMHAPKEIWFAGASEPNHFVIVSSTLDNKIASILQHKSQVKNAEQTEMRMRQALFRVNPDGSIYFAETFRRILM